MKFAANTASKSVAGKEAKELSKAIRRNSYIKDEKADAMNAFLIKMATSSVA